MSHLIEFLRKYKNDSGIMAALRNALIQTKRHISWSILARFGGVGSDYDSLVIQTIAGLYAHHPKEAETGNIGDMCFNMLDHEEKVTFFSEDNKPGTIAKRFQFLLASDNEEIFSRIIRLILFAKSKEIPVNYEQTLHDLQQWKYNKSRVRTEWAQSFWGFRDKAGEDK